MSHEISHLIYFYEKTVKPLKLGHLNSVEEEIFLSEGLAHLTEILCGFSTTGGTIYFAKDFLKDPGRYSLTAQDADGNIDSVGKRGGITLFLNWMFWQRGGAHWNTDSTKIEDKGGIRFLRALMSSQRVGTDNLSSAFGRELSLVFPEWVKELSLQKARCLKDENPLFDPISHEILTLGAYSGEVPTSDSTKVLLNGPVIQTPLNSSPTILPYSFFWSDNITVTGDHIIKFHTTSAGSQFGVILNRIQL